MSYITLRISAHQKKLLLKKKKIKYLMAKNILTLHIWQRVISKLYIASIKFNTTLKHTQPPSKMKRRPNRNSSKEERQMVNSHIKNAHHWFPGKHKRTLWYHFTWDWPISKNFAMTKAGRVKKEQSFSERRKLNWCGLYRHCYGDFSKLKIWGLEK